MGNNIVEENPTQQSSTPSGPQGQGAGGGEEKVRKQARQLAYDVRYKVKQGFKDGQKTDPASLKRAYLAQLGKSPAPGPVKMTAKKMLVGEEYDFTDISETVSSSISNAIKSIFVENKKACEICGSFEHSDEDCSEVVNEALQEKKYKIRVTDKKTGKSYTRFADRAKISELRKNPNISSVEMTGYGTPYEGEKNKGSQTAAVKSGKGLAKKDYDGDGKVESPTAEYKGSKDKAIKKALHKEHHQKDANGNTIPHDGVDESVGSAVDKALGAVGDTAKVAGKAAKGGVKVASKVAKGAADAAATVVGTPIGVAKSIKKGWQKGTASESVDFIGEVNTENDNPNANVKKIDTMKGKNKIIINPNMGEQKQLEPGKEQPTGVAAPVAPPEPPKEDSKEKRIRMVKRQILQKKMQAVRQGGGIDIVAHNEPQGKLVDEGLIGKAIQGAGKVVGGAENVATGAVKGTVGAAKKVVKTAAGAVSGGAKSATRKESVSDYQKLETSKQIIKDILTKESVGSAVDKALGAVGDTAKVAGKAAKGSVKVASKVAKGTADAAATAAGTPIGVAKSIKKGWQKGTASESVNSMVQSALNSLNMISEKEVKVKDTKKVVDAIRAYDKSKDASKDADWDTEHGEKEKGDKEKKYAKKERGEIDKDDPNWKNKKYHTGLHGESYEKEPPIKDQSDKQIASVTFDGAGDEGGATIKGSGDPREIPTFVNLIKQKLRARGILVSHNVPEGEQLDELNKRERVEAGQGKRAAKKGDWSKQKAKTGRRNINRFETKPVEREHGTLDKGKQSFKKVKVLNPKSGYSKKTDATKGKVTSRKLSQTGTDLKPDYGPQKPHWAGNVHSDRAQQQRRSEHKAKRGVKTKGTVAADIKKSMKETLDPAVQSAVDSLNSIAKKEGLI